MLKTDFGTIMMNMKPYDYLGKRIKLTGFIKSKNLSDWAGMWMRVDGPDKNEMLQFDNMSNRPIKGTSDWTKYEIVLDVPDSSTNIAYGVLISGNGQVWFSRLLLEVVSNDIVSTNLPRSYNYINDWFKTGSRPDLFEIGKDENVKYNGQAAHYIKSVADVKEGFGTIMKQIPPGEYLGKRVKLTGNIKTEDIDNQAAMWMRVDGPDSVKALQFDNMTNRPIKGTTDWTKYEIVLDVPENSTGIAYGVLSGGNGEAWFDDLKFEVVGNDVPTTNMLK